MVAATRTVSVMSFRIAPGARIAKRDADIVGRELLRLRTVGTLTRELVLDAAASVDSPLHRFFEWNNRSAAHEYRLVQAGYLLRSIEVVVHDAKGEPVALKAFYNVDTESDGRRWEPMQFVFDDRELSARVLQDAYSMLEGWIARFKKYEWAQQAIPFATKALSKIKRRGKGRTGKGRTGKERNGGIGEARKGAERKGGRGRQR